MIDSWRSGILPINTRFPVAVLTAAILHFSCFCAIAPAAQQNSTSVIAVADFVTLNDDEEVKWVGPAFAEALATKLVPVKAIQVVERLQLERLLNEYGLAEVEIADPDTAQRAGKVIGAEYVIIGSVQLQGDVKDEENAEVLAQARMVRVETGEIAMTESAHGKLATLFELETELCFRTAKALNFTLTEPERQAIANAKAAETAALRAFGHGNFCARQGDFERAIEGYLRTLDRDPNFGPALFNLALAYYRQRRFEEAIEMLDRLLKLQPDNRTVRAVMAEACHRAIDLSRPYQVQLFVLKGLRAMPSHEGLREQVSKMNLTSELANERVIVCQEALKQFPNDARLMLGCGWSYMALDDLSNADNWFRKALAASPNDNLRREAYRGLRHVAVRREDLKAAIEISQEMYVKLRIVDPAWAHELLDTVYVSNIDNRMEIAVILERFGQFVLSVNQRHLGVLHMVGEMLFRLEYPERALLWFDRLVNIEKSSMPANRALEIAQRYVDGGQYEKAAQLIRIALQKSPTADETRKAQILIGRLGK